MEPQNNRRPTQRPVNVPQHRQVQAIQPTPATVADQPAKRRRLPKTPKKLAIILVGVLIVLAASFIIYKFMQTSKELERARDPETAAQDEAAALAEVIDEFLELPKNESPTIATVKDVTRLQDQLFFQRAQNGDKVLIYPESGKAVLYRPSTKKVIEYASVKLNGSDSVTPEN